MNEKIADALLTFAEKLKSHYPHTPSVCSMIDQELAKALDDLIEIEEEEEEPYEDPDAHTHDYDEYGECTICGAIKYKSCLWYELYGGEP